MKIEKNTVVSLHYRLSNHKTGETIEETFNAEPLLFVYGIGAMIPEFEDNLSNKVKGDKFEFNIKAENAYGVTSDDQIAELPKNIFNDENGKFNVEQVFEGAVLPMVDNEGNHLSGKVLSVNDETIKMDFNHPLSGVDLNFDVEVIEVRDANQEELDHGHAHGVGGHNH